MADPITSYVAVRSPGDEDEIDIGRYVRFLLRGWWLLALGALAGGAAGFVVASSVPLRYESVATLRITPPRSPSCNCKACTPPAVGSSMAKWPI